jgi:polyphosphate:AMP phosphotransferase
VGLFLGSWYTEPLISRAYGKISEKTYIQALRQAASFEKTLTDDGALFIKFWLHVSKDEQLRRLKAFQASEKHRFRVRKRDFKHHGLYSEMASAAARALRETSTADVPWTVIEANDHRYRNVAIAHHLIQRLGARLEQSEKQAPLPPPPNPQVADPITILDTLDLGKRLAGPEYESELDRAQAELNRLSRKLPKRSKSAIFVFEGWDAAGKGGAIRRITRALDARQYRVMRTAAPTDEERAHHYLWRFWRHLPRRGRITIYDRSWYGRVLVERVEGLAVDTAWKRAYNEINDFEEQLANDEIIVVKFWLHISRDEQLRRFKEREAEPWKQYKLTPDDFRNRERGNLYESAVNDMLANTDTEYAPWVLVEAEDKRFARVKVLRTVCDRLAAAL